MGTSAAPLNGYILRRSQWGRAEGAVAAATGRLEQVVLMNR